MQKEYNWLLNLDGGLSGFAAKEKEVLAGEIAPKMILSFTAKVKVEVKEIHYKGRNLRYYRMTDSNALRRFFTGRRGA